MPHKKVVFNHRRNFKFTLNGLLNNKENKLLNLQPKDGMIKTCSKDHGFKNFEKMTPKALRGSIYEKDKRLHERKHYTTSTQIVV